jgi:hypothetical protein
VHAVREVGVLARAIPVREARLRPRAHEVGEGGVDLPLPAPVDADVDDDDVGDGSERVPQVDEIVVPGRTVVADLHDHRLRQHVAVPAVDEDLDRVGHLPPDDRVDVDAAMEAALELRRAAEHH